MQTSAAGGTVSGYAASGMLRECIAKNGGCCAAYIVPTKTGSYPVNDANCNSPLGTIQVTGTQPQMQLDPPARNLLQQDTPADNVWADALVIDVALGAALRTFCAGLAPDRALVLSTWATCQTRCVVQCNKRAASRQPPRPAAAAACARRAMARTAKKP